MYFMREQIMIANDYKSKIMLQKLLKNTVLVFIIIMLIYAFFGWIIVNILNLMTTGHWFNSPNISIFGIILGAFIGIGASLFNEKD